MNDILIRIILAAALLALALSYNTHEKVSKIVSFIEKNEFVKE